MLYVVLLFTLAICGSCAGMSASDKDKSSLAIAHRGDNAQPVPVWPGPARFSAHWQLTGTASVTITAATNGSDLSTCGLSALPCRTVRFAVQRACSLAGGGSSGPAVVRVLGGGGLAGQFLETGPVVINTSIVIIGVAVNGATPVINFSTTSMPSGGPFASGFRAMLQPNGSLALQSLTIVGARAQAGVTATGEAIDGGAALSVVCLSGCQVNISSTAFANNTVMFDKIIPNDDDDSEYSDCRARVGGGAVRIAHAARSMTAQESIVLRINNSSFDGNGSPGTFAVTFYRFDIQSPILSVPV
jgi:hypothetical protein